MASRAACSLTDVVGFRLNQEIPESAGPGRPLDYFSDVGKNFGNGSFGNRGVPSSLNSVSPAVWNTGAASNALL
jgi:hypothetical protein